jgi:hypothetical protein
MMGFFKIVSLELFCLGWLQTIILLIAASSVARITGMSHQCPALFLFIFIPVDMKWYPTVGL